jgi:hypothetical protein
VLERPCLGEENKNLDLAVLLFSNVCEDRRTVQVSRVNEVSGSFKTVSKNTYISNK